MKQVIAVEESQTAFVRSRAVRRSVWVCMCVAFWSLAGVGDASAVVVGRTAAPPVPCETAGAATNGGLLPPCAYPKAHFIPGRAGLPPDIQSKLGTPIAWFVTLSLTSFVVVAFLKILLTQPAVHFAHAKGSAFLDHVANADAFSAWLGFVAVLLSPGIVVSILKLLGVPFNPLAGVRITFGPFSAKLVPLVLVVGSALLAFGFIYLAVRVMGGLRLVSVGQRGSQPWHQAAGNRRAADGIVAMVMFALTVAVASSLYALLG